MTLSNYFMNYIQSTLYDKSRMKETWKNLICFLEISFNTKDNYCVK